MYRNTPSHDCSYCFKDLFWCLPTYVYSINCKTTIKETTNASKKVFIVSRRSAGGGKSRISRAGLFDWGLIENDLPCLAASFLDADFYTVSLYFFPYTLHDMHAHKLFCPDLLWKLFSIPHLPFTPHTTSTISLGLRHPLYSRVENKYKLGQ